jgi:hypothetical protein
VSAVVEQLVPAVGATTVAAVLERVRAAPARMPFGDDAVALGVALAAALQPHARRHPELGALAFWLRAASLRRLRPAERPAVRRVPRGLAFHVPPSNVETMAAYSLMLSLLCGNANVVRVSPARGEVGELLCAALGRTLAAPRFAAIEQATAVVAYGHEPEPTAELSSACDVRLVWGGDDTVRTIRAVPLGVHARDLAFADRFSLAALSAPAWLAATAAERDVLAGRLFSDVFWVDQQGCASPRLLAWCGDSAGEASGDLFARLQAEIERRGYLLPTAAVTAKLAAVAGAAIDLPVGRVRRISNELFVAELEHLDRLPREIAEAGLLFEARLGSLAELAPLLARADQTLVTHGFGAGELAGLVDAAAGRGLDRIVPLGTALSFSHRWDGMDLVEELTRGVVVEAA